MKHQMHKRATLAQTNRAIGHHRDYGTRKGSKSRQLEVLAYGMSLYKMYLALDSGDNLFGADRTLASYDERKMTDDLCDGGELSMNFDSSFAMLGQADIPRLVLSRIPQFERTRQE
ncbi:hypothetical protein AAE478_002969 [Parahypoxylon ruwenzoriense]